MHDAAGTSRRHDTDAVWLVPHLYFPGEYPSTNDRLHARSLTSTIIAQATGTYSTAVGVRGK